MYSVIGADGQVYGPVDMVTLKIWCSEGRVTPTTNLHDPVSGGVLRASDLQELYGLFPPQSAPPAFQPQTPNVMMGQSPVQINNYMHPPSYSPAFSAPKSRTAAALLAFFLGALGVHRFYLGHSGTGVAMLLITVLTCGYGGIITGIWALVDFILILTGSLGDARGQALTP
jgi:TM2 domain-containing membrane protein YozV